jgi:hypothetical protein
MQKITPFLWFDHQDEPRHGGEAANEEDRNRQVRLEAACEGK